MTDTVFVSVVMPVRNEEVFIAQSLGAVLTQDYPSQSMEILVADGASEDRTIEIITSLPGAERVRVISNPRRSQAAGLNEAILQAKGEIIVRVDGHTIIAPDYIRQCVAALRETHAANVGGPMEMVGLTPMGQAIAAATQLPFAVPSAFHVSRRAQFTDTVYLGAWPRQVFERIGGFDERLAPNEDYEFNYRLRHSGGRIYLSPAIHSRYFGRQTLRALTRQYFSYGRAKTGTLKKYPASLRARQLVAPGFVGAVIGGLPMAVLLPPLGWLWLFMLITYLATTMVFSLAAARRAGYHLVWRFPLVFITIHLAWGTGFWAGLLFGDIRIARRRAVPSLLALSKDA